MFTTVLVMRLPAHAFALTCDDMEGLDAAERIFDYRISKAFFTSQLKPQCSLNLR